MISIKSQLLNPLGTPLQVRGGVNDQLQVPAAQSSGNSPPSRGGVNDQLQVPAAQSSGNSPQSNQFVFGFDGLVFLKAIKKFIRGF
jgi:hypothetical protein